MQRKAYVTSAICGLIVLLLVTVGCGATAESWPTGQDQQAQVEQLVDAATGSSLSISGVDWCVDGVSSHEYECRLEMTGVGGDPDPQQVTYFMKCDTSAKTCRLEQD